MYKGLNNYFSFAHFFNDNQRWGQMDCKGNINNKLCLSENMYTLTNSIIRHHKQTTIKIQRVQFEDIKGNTLKAALRWKCQAKCGMFKFIDRIMKVLTVCCQKHWKENIWYVRRAPA